MGIRDFLNNLREKVENAFKCDDRSHSSPDPIHLRKVLPAVKEHPNGPHCSINTIGSRAATPVALAARSLQARNITDAKGVMWFPCVLDIPSTDLRYGKPALMIEHMPFSQYQLKIWDSVGREVGKLGYFGAHTRDRSEWYSGYGPGTKDTAPELAEKAREQGDGTIFIEWEEGYVLGPISPTQRTGNL